MSEYYEEKVNTSKNYADRYKNCKLLIDKESGDTLLSTREISDIQYSREDTYHRVKHHEIGRLDMISYQYYNTPMLWWVIAQANNIFDPFQEIEVSTLLRIPSLERLYGNRGILL